MWNMWNERQKLPTIEFKCGISVYELNVFLKNQLRILFSRTLLFYIQSSVEKLQENAVGTSF